MSLGAPPFRFPQSNSKGAQDMNDRFVGCGCLLAALLGAAATAAAQDYSFSIREFQNLEPVEPATSWISPSRSRASTSIRTPAFLLAPIK